MVLFRYHRGLVNTVVDYAATGFLGVSLRKPEENASQRVL